MARAMIEAQLVAQKSILDISDLEESHDAHRWMQTRAAA